jgi:hypothetical protein
LKTVRKIGTIIGVAVLTSVALFLLGVLASLAGNMGWIHLGEYQPWLPLIGLEDGFVLGLVLGVIVVLKKAKAKARGMMSGM